ncbi:MAG: hypothetical protein V1866_07000 [archaeon]
MKTGKIILSIFFAAVFSLLGALSAAAYPYYAYAQDFYDYQQYSPYYTYGPTFFRPYNNMGWYSPGANYYRYYPTYSYRYYYSPSYFYRGYQRPYAYNTYAPVWSGW